MFIIKNEKYNNYYKSTIKDSYHFVLDIEQAKKFKELDQAIEVLESMKKLRNKDFIKIVKI